MLCWRSWARSWYLLRSPGDTTKLPNNCRKTTVFLAISRSTVGRFAGRRAPGVFVEKGNPVPAVWWGWLSRFAGNGVYLERGGGAKSKGIEPPVTSVPGKALSMVGIDYAAEVNAVGRRGRSLSVGPRHPKRIRPRPRLSCRWASFEVCWTRGLEGSRWHDFVFITRADVEREAFKNPQLSSARRRCRWC